ncbi:MAG: hypothetical protein WC455_27940 [Dehalococcoidia bacterium]|jgi:hypothetical protein
MPGSVKKAELVELIQECIDESIEAAIEVFNEEIAPLLDFGSPAKVIGKPYEQWTGDELMKARAIFGTKLEDYIADKEVNELLQMEREV